MVATALLLLMVVVYYLVALLGTADGDGSFAPVGGDEEFILLAIVAPIAK